MDRLIVICEGGIHTVEYLQRNGVYPSKTVLEPSKFQELIPYLTSEDDVLVIIKGLTDFTMSSIYALLNKLNEPNVRGKFKRAVILSNLPLGHIPFDYYLYSGDIFYGSIQKMVQNKKFDLDSNGNIIEDKKRKHTLKGVVVESPKNPIMAQYKKYNDKKVKLLIYGSKMLAAPVESSEVVDYGEKIVNVDLFENSQKNVMGDKE